MRLLIYTFALMSAFFVSAEPDMSDLKPPTSNPKTIGTCHSSQGGFFGSEVSLDACLAYIETTYLGHPYKFHHVEPIDSLKTDVYYQNKQYTHMIVKAGSFVVGSELSCPPSGFPDYSISIGAGASLMCAKELAPQDCPAGYHSKAVSKALGSTECVPKECPAAGTGENLASTPMTGGVPFSGGGMYCNDGCAYSVNAEQISSEKYAVGTSQGVACGDKPYDNKKLADDGETDGCSTATNGEIDIMSCPNANPTTPETDPHNNDDSKVGEEGTPEKPKDTCSPDDASCNLKNIETEIENSSNKIIDNDNELHNKKIDADTKNTQAVLNIMESVDTAILRQTSQDDKLHAVTVSKFNKLIDAVNGLDVGGGGGGNGTGNGANNGTCVGEGCSDDSKYQGDCEGELCDLDIKPELEQIDSDIIDWFNEKITLPTELTSSFSTMQNFITSNFASFNGTCVPFTLDVSIAGNQKSIPVSQHCEPYETYFKPLVEWLLWTLTAMTLLNMAAQVFRSFSAV